MRKKILTIFLIITSFSLHSEDILNISVTSTDITFNPFYTYTASEAQYLTGIYEGLVSYHPENLSPNPALAESWTLSEDKRTYTFKIREGIKFSNGDPITAEVFKNSFIKLLHPETKAEFASLLDIIDGALEYRTGENSDPKSVKINSTSENKLIITLKKRAPYFTKILCHHSFTPIHPSLLEKRFWSYKDVISSGPYTIKREGNRAVLNKNRFYWDKNSVGFNRINLIEYENPINSINDYNSGKIDWMMEVNQLDSLLDMDSLVVNPLFGTTYYFFNPNYKEYKDPEIRNAISQLIPWNNIRENQYIPANSLIPPFNNFPKNYKKSEQNIDEALKVLKEKGFPQGKGLSKIILSVPGNPDEENGIATLIKESIESNTVIDVEIIKTPYPGFFTVNRTMDFTISTLSWIGDFADPLTFLEMWTKSSNLNDAKFNNPQYDEILENSSNLNKNDRYKELARAENILLDETIVIPISHSPGINIINTRFIENWFPNSLDIHPFKYLKPAKKLYIPGLI